MSAMIEGKGSQFPIVNFSEGDGWKEIISLSEGVLDNSGLRRLSPLLTGRMKSTVIEFNYIDKDYRDTFSYYHSKRFFTPSSRCIRLHFFSDQITQGDFFNRRKLQGSYLGYSILRPTKPNCIGRTLVAPFDELLRDSHLRLCRETITLRGNELSIEGFPFISQDADVTICAHSALWDILRYYSNRYSRYSEIHPYQVGSLVTTSFERTFPSGGLQMWQISEALRQANFEPIIYDRSQHQDFDHLLYTYIESGIPCVVGLPGHAVACFGHYSDMDSSVIPDDGKFHYSSTFNKAFIVNDDNLHPYQAITEVKGSYPLLPEHPDFTIKDVDSFIAPLPDKVFMTAEGFQKVAERTLRKFLDRSSFLLGQTLLLRIFLTTCRSFKRVALERDLGDERVKRLYLETPLPHFMWVCEVSTPAVYADDGLVVGELVWDATRNPHEIDGLIALHFPENLISDRSGPLNLAPKLQTLDLQAQKPYPLYRSNLKTIE